MTRSFTAAMVLGIGALVSACGNIDYSTNAPQQPALQFAAITASGAITDKVAEFRTLIGDPSNGGAAGEQAAGRREISWDGAAANAFDNRSDFPAAFFNTTVKNGAIFTTPGSGFRNDSTKFVDVNAAYANEFASFSPTKIFAPVGVNVMDVLFQVAGQPTPARVTGFGVVFSDVDVANRTTIEFFDALGMSLGTIAAPVRSDAAGLSFAGVKFSAAVVARARITLGTGALGANANDISIGGATDLVVVDNFIYGEPRALP